MAKTPPVGAITAAISAVASIALALRLSGDAFLISTIVFRRKFQPVEYLDWDAVISERAVAKIPDNNDGGVDLGERVSAEVISYGRSVSKFRLRETISMLDKRSA